MSCNVCEFGYELKDSKYILANCIMGENEKCHKCNFQTINECLSCNKGYYLPINNKNKTICTKCKIDGCETCDTITGNCQKCQSFYKPIFDEYNSTIISCKKMCELGDKNKCLSCDGKEENRCLTCNIGYKLMKNGECKKIENSFIGIYNVTSVSNFVRIIDFDVGNWGYHHIVELSDIDAYINETKINLEICYYNHYYCFRFQKTGIYEIKIIIKKTLSTLRGLFLDCEQLLYVKFSETFDTSHVLNTEDMFMGCTSLKSVNLSSFNTSLVSQMTFMFYNCYELTSIDLSNFETKNVLSFQDMFTNNYKLSWVDISSFDTSKSIVSPSSDYLFQGVSGKGEIIINIQGYNNDIPEGWNVTYI